MTGAARVLVVDDDADVRELIRDCLAGHGFEIMEADACAAARAVLAERRPDVVLLDVGLPGEDGLSLARYLREHHDVGIIMVSAAGETVDRVIGLEVGADDYIAKPFDPRELRARIKSVRRRYAAQATQAPAAGGAAPLTRVPFGHCVLEIETRRLFDGCGEEVPLTAMEFDLLKVFAERPNRALSRDQLMNLTRNRDWDPYDRSVDIRIARLRRKIEPEPDKPTVIRTVRGVGYMYVPG